jgi:hypothetical protein
MEDRPEARQGLSRDRSSLNHIRASGVYFGSAQTCESVGQYLHNCLQIGMAICDKLAIQEGL